MSKLSAEKFILKLGYLLEKIALPSNVESEINLEYAVLPYIRGLIQKELIGDQKLDGVLYYHGRNKEEKGWWTKSKQLQNVNLFGKNTSDMFIAHKEIGAVALEFKYVNLLRKEGGRGLTGSIQRAIGQSIIATIKHPFAICMIVFRQQKEHLKTDTLKQLKDLLWKHHRIYLIVRSQ